MLDGVDEFGYSERWLEVLVAVGVATEDEDAVLGIRSLVTGVRLAKGSVAGACKIAGRYPSEVPLIGI